ncbi:hypothetical protein FQN60_010502 [Etheostoma spectabile]|uniref:Uncharacterized protein n=1 Tax=Etheostoma spectabile TaxID=54343 RepID=A0A5J5D526_9PERO|nr:hypothetical protein FQN60_010502 [Etheostoma spectabile]
MRFLLLFSHCHRHSVGDCAGCQ